MTDSRGGREWDREHDHALAPSLRGLARELACSDGQEGEGAPARVLSKNQRDEQHDGVRGMTILPIQLGNLPPLRVSTRATRPDQMLIEGMADQVPVSKRADEVAPRDLSRELLIYSPDPIHQGGRTRSLTPEQALTNP